MTNELDKIAEEEANLLGNNLGQAQIGVRTSLSMEETLKLIGMGIYEMKQKGLNTIIRRSIARNIPARTDMSAIYNKREINGVIRQVDRKLLILAWLSSDDGDADLYAEIADAAEDAAEQALSLHFRAINDSLLKEYGMPTLDSRHPFDWVVMNALFCAHLSIKGNQYENVVERMEKLLNRI
jgi:hypothetical protein